MTIKSPNDLCALLADIQEEFSKLHTASADLHLQVADWAGKHQQLSERTDEQIQWLLGKIDRAHYALDQARPGEAIGILMTVWARFQRPQLDIQGYENAVEAESVTQMKEALKPERIPLPATHPLSAQSVSRTADDLFPKSVAMAYPGDVKPPKDQRFWTMQNGYGAWVVLDKEDPNWNNLTYPKAMTDALQRARAAVMILNDSEPDEIPLIKSILR